MKKCTRATIITILLIAFFTPTLSLAQSYFPKYKPPKQNFGSKYDWKSGNTYNWRKDSTGTTRVYGNNYKTGSNWNTTIKPNGNMNGFDSKGNSWNYNKNTSTYINYGTGKICTGKGATRFCY